MSHKFLVVLKGVKKSKTNVFKTMEVTIDTNEIKDFYHSYEHAANMIMKLTQFTGTISSISSTSNGFTFDIENIIRFVVSKL